MKISIITVCYNSVATIEDTINSVANQTYYDIEHIIIDGNSTDGTQAVISRNISKIARFLSENDRGVYDAMNKGITLATGEIVGILNADDFYKDEHVIAKVMAAFTSHPIDSLFADLVFVKPNNLDKIVRYYSGADFKLSKFSYGWMPPHPTFFVKRDCYLKYGLFKLDYKIAADFDLMARFLVQHCVGWHYLPEVIIKMRTGGLSTKNFRSNITLNHEVFKACSENGIATNYLKIYSKYLLKSLQLLARP